MADTVHAFDYLAAPDKHPPMGVCVAFGDEAFLKRLVIGRLRDRALGDDGADVPFTRFEGPIAEWRDVRDELATVSLFGSGRRLVVVDRADEFVTANRSKLEQYVSAAGSGGVLILDVAKWPANTRLFKIVANSGLPIECRVPQKPLGRQRVLDEDALLRWLVRWSGEAHDATLQVAAAELVLDMVGPELGMLDQELAKLALFAGPGGRITPEMVRDVAGSWRTRTTWELLDAATDGNAADALDQLDRLLTSGEKPHALFGQIAWSLRRFAAATRIYQRAERHRRRLPLPAALEQAGFRKWPRERMDAAQRRLRQLGRERAGRLYRWLLDADLALKGSHSRDDRARFVIERLLVRLAKQADRPHRRR